MFSELGVPANPLLHKGSTETAREGHAETEEPKDIDANCKTWSFEWLKRLRVRSRQFLSNLLKKPSRHVGGIWLEIFVTFDEECSNRRGEYTRLETIYKGKRDANAKLAFKNAHR
jgi:hypothetical protein